MSKTSRETRTVTYHIPNNFIEGGMVFNGMFRLRNLIEAIIVGGIFVLIGQKFPIDNLRFRIAFVVGVSLPWFFLCLVGINGDSFLTFVRLAWRWKKNNNVMLFDENVHSFEASPLEMMMSEETPRDKLISKIEDITNRRKAEIAKKRAAAEFRFEEDSEWLKLKTPAQRAEETLARDSRHHQKDLQAEETVYDLDDDSSTEVVNLDLCDSFALNTRGQQSNNADSIDAEELF